MPRLRLLRTLGKVDAERLNLGIQAKEGGIVTVDGDAYEELLKRGLGVDAGSTSDPAAVQAAARKGA